MQNDKFSLFRAGSIVVLLTIIGKILSFGKEIVFSSAFGVSPVVDAFFFANIIPSLFNSTLAMSMLTFFIPIYKDCQINEGDVAANRFTSNLITVFFIFNFLLTIFTFTFSRELLLIIGHDLSTNFLLDATYFVKLLVLSFPITIVVIIYVNLLNANQRYIPPLLVVILNSLTLIIFIHFFSRTFGIFIVPIVSIMTWLLQIFIQKYFVKDIYKYSFVFDLHDLKLKKMFILAVPVIFATAADQINLSVNNVICAYLGEGNISALNYSQKLFNLVNGTLSAAIITIFYPTISALFAQKRLKKLEDIIVNCLKIIVLILLPITTFCIISRTNIVTIAFYRGAFPHKSIVVVANVFCFYCLCFIFTAIKDICTRVLYVYGDSKKPTTINIISIIINIILSFLLSKQIGVYGLALAASIAAFFAGGVELKLVCALNSNKIKYKILVMFLGKTIISTIIMGTVINIILNKYPHILGLIFSFLFGICIYILSLFFLKETLVLNLFRRFVTKNS